MMRSTLSLTLGLLMLTSCLPLQRSAEPETRQGFRLQLVTTTERQDAEDVMDTARDWYHGLPPGTQNTFDQGAATLPIDIVWRQPYYRVQLGAFLQRDAAEEALAAIRGRFPDAFIVPAPVQRTR